MLGIHIPLINIFTIYEGTLCLFTVFIICDLYLKKRPFERKIINYARKAISLSYEGGVTQQQPLSNTDIAHIWQK